MASKTTNPFTFLQQVRAEGGKVTWPTRRETLISSLMVIAMSFLAAIFFFLADQIMIFDDDPHEASANEHVRTNREGAAGGKGAGGGGCGCN